MALPFQFGKAAFNAKAQGAALDAMTLKYDKNAIAAGRAARETASFTDATGRGRITMENFGRTFDNATRKVLIWQFAIMAVYGVIRKIGDTLQTWKDLEITLARISITTGALGARLQQYFKQVADVAISFGMPIEQTLTGMDLALRATARYADQADRGAIAVNLLSSASALANITGMQYSQAIDILVGSLRQSDMELDEGISLLDKWVSVAKNASVAVNDLSQGFAIMADAGRAAGMTVDQINGLIAALSETVTLGPVQIGNAIRALMSTLYNPGSISLLQKYGVAVRDTSGEVRSFWEVMTQLAAMKEAGVLDESVWLEIAKAAGAGQRRYAQFLALLNNFSAAMRVAAISAEAEGEAMEANKKIVETLLNTWDKFTAAQRKFLFTMGEEIGAIEDLTGVIAQLVRVFDILSGSEFRVMGINLKLTDTFFQIGRSVMFLVGTLAALKVATLAMGWMGVGPKVGAVMGKFAGVPPTAIAGSAAYAKAIQAGGYTSAGQAATAGLGTVAPGISSQAGMYALSGLLPAFMFRKMWGGGPSPTVPGWQQGMPGGVFKPGGGQRVGGKWMPGGGQWTAPTVAPMTWGGAARGARGMLTRPFGGMGRAVGALGAGAAAYGLTGEWQSAVGAGIGAAVGAKFGIVGMVAGGAIGTFAGHALADAFISEADRIKKVFEKISEDFGYDVKEMLETYYNVAQASEIGARELAAQFAPVLPEKRAAQGKSFLQQLFMPSAAQYVSPFVIGGATGEEEWTRGLGALHELNQALVDGVITIDEYRKAKQEDYIAWGELTDAAKAYMTTIRMSEQGTVGQMETAKAYAQVVQEQVERQRELAQITNRYSEAQTRIKQLMLGTGAVIDSITLKEWEQVKVQQLLVDQVNKTAEDFQAWYNVLLGSAYGYASHVEAIQQLKPLLEEYGLAIKRIPEDKWLLIQRWDPQLSTDIVQTIGTLLEMDDLIDKFTVSFPDMLRLANIEGTIADIDKVKEAITKLHKEAGDEKYAAALEEINQYLGNVLQKEIEARRIATYAGRGAEFQRPTQVRLMDAETMKAYRENLGRLPVFTDLAKSLGKTADSVLTLVDPLTGEMLRLEENTLALEMLGRVVNENTTAQEKRLEAEYNLPGWYQKPNRYMALRQSGGAGGFGPAQEGLWGTWLEFVRNRSMQTGGTVHETGPYFLHKKEVVVSGETLSGTNVLLGNSYRVLMTSQQYLSSINLGILGVRQEIQQLRKQLTAPRQAEEGTSDFGRIAKADYSGISSLGVRRR